MTKLSKKQIIEKEIRKERLQKELIEKRVRNHIEYQSEQYEKYWPKSKRICTQLILTGLYYGIIVGVKLFIFLILILIRYYTGIF